MPVPSDPSVSTIVTQALKRAGRVSPTAGQITEATDHALQEVKADIMLAAPTHPHLQTTSTTVTVKGRQRYAVPTDSNEHASLALLDGPTDWRGTAQAGGATTITLASSMTVEADDIIGKYILVTAGPGQNDYREILAYVPGTKVATVESAWTVNPTSSSTYLVVYESRQLWPKDTTTEFDRRYAPFGLGRPYEAAKFNQEFMVYPIPDLSTYGLLQRYWADLSKLDETGTLFVQLLREWRSVWIQGIAVKSMQRFDEDRYQSELGVYMTMLSLLTSQTCTVRQVRFYDT
jgi:hypothetical protein